MVQRCINAVRPTKARATLVLFAPISAKIIYNGERRVRKFGQLPKSDGCTERNNGVARHLHALALIASVPLIIFAIVPFAYRRHYLLHVHVASRIAVSLPLIRELVRSAFVSRTDYPVKCICRFVGLFLFISARMDAETRGSSPISCTKDGNY